MPVLRHATSAPRPPKDWRPEWWSEAEYHLGWAWEHERLANLCARTGWRARQHGVHPEGMIHLAWRLAFTSGCDASDLVASIPLSDLVVHVHADLAIAAHRLQGKQGDLGPINLRLMGARPGEWLAATRLYEQIIDHVQDRTAVIRICNNAAAPEPAAHELAAEITRAASLSMDENAPHGDLTPAGQSASLAS